MKKAVLHASEQMRLEIDGSQTGPKAEAPLKAQFPKALFKAPLLVAVSGGSDSMGLLRILEAWRGPAGLSVATIDHGLRQESADEAKWVAEQCAQLNVPHQTLVWEDATAGARVSERAREARYNALAKHARELGAIVLLGHTLDDQIETLRMRLARQCTQGNGQGNGQGNVKDSGQDNARHAFASRGLMGMSACIIHKGVQFLRPLLNVRRDELRDWQSCVASNMPPLWLEDPTNKDLKFERPRLRQAKVAPKHQADLIQYSSLLARLRAVEQHFVAEFLQSNAQAPLPNCFAMPRQAFNALPLALRHLTLGWLCAVVGGAERPMMSSALQQACKVGSGISLGLVRVDFRRADEVWVYRELREAVQIGSDKIEELKNKLSSAANGQFRLPPRDALKRHLLPTNVACEACAPCLHQWVAEEDAALVGVLRELVCS